MTRKSFVLGWLSFSLCALVSLSGCGSGSAGGVSTGASSSPATGPGILRNDIYDVTVYVRNSTEFPVDLQLQSNGSAGASFDSPNSGNSCSLQPGAYASISFSVDESIHGAQAFNIVYTFPDGSTIDQRCTDMPGMVNIASSSQGSFFGVSTGYYVNQETVNVNVGQEFAKDFNLSGLWSDVVTGAINAACKKSNVPTNISTTNYCYYSISISQKDYNLDNLCGVGWYVDPARLVNTPPPLTMAYQSSLQHYLGGAWQTPVTLSADATIGAFYQSPIHSAQILASCIGLSTNAIALDLITSSVLQPLLYTTFPDSSGVTQISFNTNSYAKSPAYVAAFSDYTVQYYDGQAYHTLHDSGWASAAMQMSVNWNSPNGSPQVVVGLADGAVEYYDGSTWTQLHDEGWDTSIMKLSAYWNSSNVLQVVVGLGDGAVEYWNGASWSQLQDTSWGSPVYQMSCVFNATGANQPNVVVGLFNGSMYYYTGGWGQLRGSDGRFAVISPSWNGSTPTILAGFSDGSVSLYDGNAGVWWPLQAATGNRVQFLSAHWDTYSLVGKQLEYVFSSSMQYKFGNWTTSTNYPAIPGPTK